MRAYLFRSALLDLICSFLGQKFAGSEKSNHICNAHLKIEGVSGLGLSRYKSSPAFLIALAIKHASSSFLSVFPNKVGQDGRQLEGSIPGFFGIPIL